MVIRCNSGAGCPDFSSDDAEEQEASVLIPETYGDVTFIKPYCCPHCGDWVNLQKAEEER